MPLLIWILRTFDIAVAFTDIHNIFSTHSLSITMRTTLVLDDDLLATAARYTGLKEKSALVREALRALIERESARRLAGGSIGVRFQFVCR